MTVAFYVSNEVGAVRGSMGKPNAATKTHEFSMSGFLLDAHIGTDRQRFYTDLRDSMEKAIARLDAIYRDEP